MTTTESEFDTIIDGGSLRDATLAEVIADIKCD